MVPFHRLHHRRPHRAPGTAPYNVESAMQALYANGGQTIADRASTSTLRIHECLSHANAEANRYLLVILRASCLNDLLDVP